MAATSINAQVVKWALSEGYSPDSIHTDKKEEILDAYNAAHSKTTRKHSKSQATVSFRTPMGETFEIPGAVDFREKNVQGRVYAVILADPTAYGFESPHDARISQVRVFADIVTVERKDCKTLSAFLED